MSELSREEVEQFRREEFIPGPGEPWSVEYNRVLHAICDAALHALSRPPDSEAVRLLRELVACRDLKDSLPSTEVTARALRTVEYGHRESMAWKAARAHLARQPAAQSERRRIEQLEAQNEAMVRLLSTLGVLAQPENIRLPDGRVMEFMPPAEKVQEYWRELSKVLRKLMTDLPAAREPEGLDTEAIAWALDKLRNFGVLNNTMDNALMADRLEAMLRASSPTEGESK